MTLQIHVILMSVIVNYGHLEYKRTIWPTCNIEATIAAEADKSGLDRGLFRAILYHESRLRVNAHNKVTGDHGIGQINIKTAKAYRFDVDRLKRDCAYSVAAAAKVLLWFKRTYPHEPLWFCRYNIGTQTAPVTCNSYATLVLQTPTRLPASE